MRLRTHLAATLAAASVGCGADRVTGPADEAARAAAELERAATDIGFAGGPAAALTFHSAATALRGGATISAIELTVGTETAAWNAFGHELRFQPPPGSTTPLAEAPALRTLLAWRWTQSGMRVIHLVAAGDEGYVGEVGPFEADAELTVESPSLLIYMEGRDAVWDAVRGRQKSSVVARSTPCPQPQRPTGAPPAPTCVEADFSFELTDVEAEPFVIPFHVPTARPNTATGTRTISMGPQPVAGVRITLAPTPFPFAPTVGYLGR